MQKISDNTKRITVNVTEDQYVWLLEVVKDRRLSAFIRELIEAEMHKDAS